MTVIQVDPDTFRSWFPFFAETTDDQIEAAYAGAPSLISVVDGELRLPNGVQKRGVYLATAHTLYLALNPSAAGSGNMSSATEGSVSASFALYSDPWRRYLATTPYGQELLAILTQVQPPMPARPVMPWPYYAGVPNGGRF